MRTLTLAAVGIALLLLATWAVLVGSGVSWASTPPAALEDGGWIGAGIGTGLLVADVIAPVPSSLVMLALGRLQGFAAGAALSVLGTVLAAAFAWVLGRRGGRWLSGRMSDSERCSADRWLARHGLFAIAVTRPVPILAETVALLAGARAMPLASVLLASTLGILPAAALYAWAGSAGRSAIEDMLLFGLTLLVSGALWLWALRDAGRARFRDIP